MMNLLIATDFSEEAHWALRRAVQLASATASRGALAHVLPGSPARGAPGSWWISSDAELIVLGKRAAGIV